MSDGTEPPKPFVDIAINPAEVTLTFEGETYLSPIDQDRLPEASASKRRSDPVAYGTALFESVIRSETVPATGQASTASGYEQVRERRHNGLVYRLRLSGSELRTLGWEYLYDPRDRRPLTIAERSPFFRYFGDEPRHHPSKARKVLVAIASPPAMPPPTKQLDIADWVDAAHAALEPLARNGLLTYEVATSDDDEPLTRERLNRLLADDVDILHLVCHGGHLGGDGYSLAIADSKKGIDGRTGNADDAWRTTPDRLSTEALQLVVLAACNGFSGGEEAEEGASAGIADLFIERGVRAVVSTQDKFGIAAARRFTEKLYADLARSGRIDMALARTRAELHNESLAGGRADWGVPVLHLNRSDGHILDVGPDANSGSGSGSGQDTIVAGEPTGSVEDRRADAGADVITLAASRTGQPRIARIELASGVELDSDRINATLWSDAAPIEGSARRAGQEGGRLPTPARAEEVGDALWQALEGTGPGDHLRDRLSEVRVEDGPDGAVRIVVDTTDADRLAALPWELLRDPRLNRHLGLSNRRPIVRYVNLGLGEPSTTVTEPLRVQMVMAQPDHEPQLRVDDEVIGLADALKAEVATGRVELMPPLRRARWQDVLDRVGEGAHVLHFIGHASDDGGEGALELLDGPVSATDLGRQLSRHVETLKLVFLNSCLTASPATDDLFSGVAQRLMQFEIPVAVAMQYRIPDDAAVTLSTAFYRSLGRGDPIDQALADARAEVAGSHRATTAWAAPTMYTLSASGPLTLLPKQGEAETPGKAGGWPRLAAVAAALLLVAVGVVRLADGFLQAGDEPVASGGVTAPSESADDPIDPNSDGADTGGTTDDDAGPANTEVEATTTTQAPPTTRPTSDGTAVGGADSEDSTTDDGTATAEPLSSDGLPDDPPVAVFTGNSGLTATVAGAVRPGFLPFADVVAAPAVELGPARVDAAPERLIIGDIGVDHPIEAVGVDEDRHLDVVEGVEAISWYRHGARPGGGGSTVLAAHVDWNGKPGPFLELRRLSPGSRFGVGLTDGSTVFYEVTGIEQVPQDELPTDRIFIGNDDRHRLHLITCGGRFDLEERRYEDNIIVTAVPISPPSEATDVCAACGLPHTSPTNT